MSARPDVPAILKKYPLAIACFLIFAACLVLMFLRGDRLSELTTKEASLNSRIAVIERNERNAVGLEGQLEQAEAAIAEMKSRLFKREERAVNASFFYDMEAEFGVRITSINQQPGGYGFYNKGGIHELKRNSTMVYSISLSGQLTEILSFIHQFTQVDPFVRVVSLQLERGNQAAGSLNCNLSVVVLSEL